MNSRPSPAWSQHHAIDPNQSHDKILVALRAEMTNCEQRHRIARHRVVVSAVVLIDSLIKDEEQLEDVLTSARLLTRNALNKESIAYAVMLLIFGADSRASRQMASEYGRAAQTLLDQGATKAANALERLEAEGIKRLARSTAVLKSATESDLVRRALISSPAEAKCLNAVPAGRHVRIIAKVLATPKGRPALQLIRLHSVAPAPGVRTLSDKPTVTTETQIPKFTPKVRPETPATEPIVTLRKKATPPLKLRPRPASPSPPPPTFPWEHQ